LGHHVRLIAPAYVKPFIKRQKDDAADAEAICEAAQRPSMRFVPVKTEEQQANGIVFRARDLLVRQRTQCVNAFRGHLMEYIRLHLSEGGLPMLKPLSPWSRIYSPHSPTVCASS
jgi:transposase